MRFVEERSGRTNDNPVFEIDGDSFEMAAQFLSAVPKGELGPTAANLESEFANIPAALDMVFQGF